MLIQQARIETRMKARKESTRKRFRNLEASIVTEHKILVITYTNHRSGNDNAGQNGRLYPEMSCVEVIFLSENLRSKRPRKLRREAPTG
jgi:hypothetical protein